MAQPRFEQAMMAGALAFMEQVALLPNLPALQQNATLHQVQTDVQQLKQTQAALARQVQQVQGDVQLILASLVATHNQSARIHNKMASQTSPLLPIQTPNGLPVPHFPATVDEVLNLSTNELRLLLLAGQQPVGGDINVRRTRFFTFIGRA